MSSGKIKQVHPGIGVTLRQRRRELAASVAKRHYELRPELADRYGERGYQKCVEDAGCHLDYLAEAVSAGSTALFVDYVGWAKITLSARGIPPEDLAQNLECMSHVLRERLPEEAGPAAARYLEEGLIRLPDLPTDLPSHLPTGADEDDLYGRLARQYLEALLEGERREARRLILDAVGRGAPARDLYLRVFQPAQREVGRLWQIGRISVAQEHFCTAATQQIMTELYPHIFATGRAGRSFVMACVSDELHEIGARMVADFFEMHGWDTFYLGANTPTDGIVETVLEREADVLGVAATMAYHVAAVREVIAAVRACEEARSVKVLAGGYPFGVDRNLGSHVGADAVARSADEAVALADALVDQASS